MREVYGDLWAYPATWRCITTNGTVKRNGYAVMGRGVAWQAANRYKGLPAGLGWRLQHEGNIPFLFSEYEIITFPVKHNWWERADLKLIASSAERLMNYVAQTDGDILLPRPGCGNGQLTWDEVKPIIEPILVSDRLLIIERAR